MEILRQESGYILREARTPLPWLITAAAGLFSFYYQYFNEPHFLAPTLLALLLALQSMVDVRRGVLTLFLNAAIAVSGLLLAPSPLWNLLAAALLMLALFTLMGLLATRLAGRPAMGGGDTHLATALGFWLGLSAIPVFFIALSITLLTYILLRKTRKTTRKTFAFGPLIALSAWLAFIFQETYWTCILSFTR